MCAATRVGARQAARGAARLTLGTLCQEDHASARAPNWPAGLVKRSQLWYQAPALCNQSHGRALATWDDETGNALQLLLGTDLKCYNTRNSLQQGHVFTERALKGQNPYADINWLC